ncbi:F-box-like protein [Ceratobasidium sp. AG-Ba]|nr:F-box-like protein [Ceratobasidium sp. AG-Ba]QRW11631.1 F-box-like protein [Ceratobasidium sp. AG-Ba]
MPPAPPDALERWKSVQHRLSSLLQEYTHACSALELWLQESKYSDGETISHLQRLLPELSNHEDVLRNARLGLTKECNSLHTMTPIHKLHPDILIDIFNMATQEWITTDFQELSDQRASTTTQLAGVCSSWRRLLLQCPTFWSNIDIVLTGPSSRYSYQRAELWANRAHRAPIWLTIRDAIIDSEDISEKELEAAPKSVVKKMVQFCAPLMPTVRTLAIRVEDSKPATIVYAMLQCWILHGSPDFIERLELRISNELPELEIPAISPDFQGTSLVRSELLSRLKSLRGIYMQNIIIDFRQVPYLALSYLYIDFSSQSEWLPTVEHLAQLFTQNQGLRSLTLKLLALDPGGSPSPPVALDRLEVLNLDARQDSHLGSVFSMISSSSPAIRLAFSVFDVNDSGFLSAARAFFSRVKVTVLFLDSLSDPELHSESQESPVNALFASMPYLHTLTLQCCNISAPVLDSLTEWRNSREGVANPWPALRYLNLFQCLTTPDIVRRLYRMQTFHTMGIFEPLEWSGLPLWSAQWAEPSVRASVEQELLERGMRMVWFAPSGENLPSWTFAV